MRRVVFLLTILVASSLGDAAAAPPVAATGRDVRVMSFNIRYGTARDGVNAWDKRKDFLAATIAAFDPDLLGTQETLAGQRDFLAKKLLGYEVFAAGRKDGENAGEMAALYFRRSRFKKLGGGHFWLSKTPDKPGSRGWDAALPRVCTWVKLADRAMPKSLPILFLNTHFDHLGRKARIESARLIRSRLATIGKGCRLIVTGDFNAGEGSRPYKVLFETGKPRPRLVDTFRVRHPKRGRNEGTFSAFRGTKTGARIDWIACSRDWDVRRAGIDHTARNGRTPSDHFPVTAVLRERVPMKRP